MVLTLRGSSLVERQVPKMTSRTQTHTPRGAGESWFVSGALKRRGFLARGLLARDPALRPPAVGLWASYLPELRFSPLSSGDHGNFCCWVVAKMKYLCLYVCVYIYSICMYNITAHVHNSGNEISSPCDVPSVNPDVWG